MPRGLKPTLRIVGTLRLTAQSKDSRALAYIETLKLPRDLAPEGLAQEGKARE